MTDHFSADIPVKSQDEDQFQRYNFSKRIADTIVKRESDDCLVIGIYGAWGEGKTSVLNFIEQELRKTDTTVIVKFNPWRYTDENALLKQFFKTLSSSLNAKIETKKELIGQILKKYGKLLNINIPGGGNAAKTMESIADVLGEASIEELKQRLSDIIKETNSNVIIFIDDIDRLEKNEIHSIFRLVKLNADFANTTYILAFDERMVSAAIGERFGEGNQGAGQSFLEKIVQVPLKIPVAQQNALRTFCLGKVQDSLNSSGIALQDRDVTRFISAFDEGILSRLTTPRLAVRYGNSLTFAIPILSGEVNTVDLILIEAIKIFFPDFYEFIKSNPDLFIKPYSSQLLQGKDKDKIEHLNAEMDRLATNLNKQQLNGFKSLLQELFPRLKEAWSNYAYNRQSEDQWFKNKRISSPSYFHKYFAYSVAKGDIPDKDFERLISSLSLQNEQKSVSNIKELIDSSSPEKFLEKLRAFEEDYSWDESILLSRVLSKCSQIFPKIGNNFFRFDAFSPYSQLAIFVCNLLKNSKDVDSGYGFIKELINSVEPLDFAFELYRWLKYNPEDENAVINEAKHSQLGRDILQRAMDEAGEMELFEKFPDNRRFIIDMYVLWSNKDKVAFDKHIENLLKSKPDHSLKLLDSFTPNWTNTAKPDQSYKGDLDQNNYKSFIAVFDKKDVMEALLRTYGEENLNSSVPSWEDNRNRTGVHQDEINMARQFLQWYIQDDNSSKTDPESIDVESVDIPE